MPSDFIETGISTIDGIKYAGKRTEAPAYSQVQDYHTTNLPLK
jgi:vacuolar-type H+-ATPase subunit B/Vma2